MVEESSLRLYGDTVDLDEFVPCAALDQYDLLETFVCFWFVNSG